MRLRPTVVDLLAATELRLRVRLHQAANRMEDADPTEVRGAQRAIRVLNAVDRLTGFRAEHRGRSRLPEGERRELPPAAPTPRPELDGLDPAALDIETRLQLREAYRAWERALRARGRRPIETGRADGGNPGLEGNELASAWGAWREALAEARR